jgi:hypothetical protein
MLMGRTLKEEFSFMAGNLDMMGGLGPQSKTATQDEMLEANASKTVADMQDTTVSYTGAVLKSLLWFHHHHPTQVMESSYAPKGMPELGVRRLVYPNNPDVHQNRPGAMVRNVPWEALDVRVNPYSMQAQTPKSRLAQMNQVVTQIVLPMMQILQQAGVMFDANAYLKKVGEFMDLPDLADILTIADPPEQEGQGGGSGGGGGSDRPGPAPAQTERKYVRENRPGATSQGTTQNLVQQLMGVNPGGNAANKRPAQSA